MLFASAQFSVRKGLVLVALSLASQGQEHSIASQPTALTLLGPSSVEVGGVWSLTVDATSELIPGVALLVVSEGGRPLANRFLRLTEDVQTVPFLLPEAAALEGVELSARVFSLGKHASASSASVHATVGGSSADALGIRSCSLGCVGTRTSVTCSVADVFVNEEVRIAFSDEIDISSANLTTVRWFENGTGQTPAGSYRLNPEDPRELIYQPLLTFDSSGNPIFGFKEDATYTLTVLGSVLDPIGPHVVSTSGQSNQTRLSCTVVASLGVKDAHPGSPHVSTLVDLVTGYDSQGLPQILSAHPAAGAVNVSLSTDITFMFDDVMNPASLVNPVTSMSNSIEIRVDPDGDVSDPTDQVSLGGTFSIALDFFAKQTLVVFRPDTPLPAVPSELQLLKIVVELLPTITDLASNPLANPGSISFQPEFQM